MLRNVVANFVAKVWAALVMTIVAPLYVAYLGIEQYGLVGFFLVVWTLASVFDLGLSAVLNREFSLRRADGTQTADLLRTFEVAHGALGLVLGMAIAVLAPLIVRHWLNAGPQTLESSIAAVRLMGVVVAAQWLSSLYTGGLLGLDRQVQLNAVNAAWATVKALGAVAVLAWVSPTVESFFVWQACAAALATGTLRILAWNALRTSQPPRVRWFLLATHKRFAAGVAGLTLLTALLTQADKLVASSALSLADFGRYSLAAAVASVVAYVVSSVYLAALPQLARAWQESPEAFSTLYHRVAQMMAVFILPPIAVAALLAEPLLAAWLRDRELAIAVAPVLSVLLAATALNGLVSVPLAAQLAAGWTGLAMRTNAVAIVIFIPAAMFLTRHYGTVGAALSWLLLNLGYVVFLVPMMHRRILSGQMARWYFVDVLAPLAMSVAAVMLMRWGLRAAPTPIQLGGVVFAALAVQAICIAALPDLRRAAATWFSRRGHSRATHQ